MPKDALQYVRRGLISQSDFGFLKELDPSPTKKYLSFIIKSYLAGVNLDLLGNRITEYDTLLNRNQVDRKDINAFKTFSQLDEYVQAFNNIRSGRELKREIKKEADVIMDTDDIFIVVPQSHESSCLYGAGTKWCTTARNNVHWEKYFYNLITFYYVQVRSEKIKNRLPADSWKLAIVVYPDGRVVAYDAADQVIGRNFGEVKQTVRLHNLFKSLRVDSSIFIPRSLDERMEDYLSYKQQEGLKELDVSRTGITMIPEAIGGMSQLERLILSENKIQVLPESIGLLSNLKTLYLFHNQLTSLPQSLSDMKQLQWLGLTGNMLSNKSIRELKRALPDTRIYQDKREAA
jgi:hypothetical protein